MSNKIKIKNRLILTFQSEPRYNLHKNEYAIIWDHEGNHIIETFEKITKLLFNEKKVKVEIGKGDEQGENSAGKSVKDPMILRYDSRSKIGTLLHELAHRLIMEHTVFAKCREKFKLDDEHRLIDLFLFEVFESLYGKEAALLRIEYEKTFKDPKFLESWEWALKLTQIQRSSLLKKIITYALG